MRNSLKIGLEKLFENIGSNIFFDYLKSTDEHYNEQA